MKKKTWEIESLEAIELEIGALKGAFGAVSVSIEGNLECPGGEGEYTTCPGGSGYNTECPGGIGQNVGCPGGIGQKVDC